MTRRARISHVLALVLAAALLATVAAAASTVLYQTGFEPADVSGSSFALGSLDGQGGWVASNATVTDAQAETGVQSVVMAPDSSIERAVAGSGQIWIVGDYRGEGSAALNPSYPADPPAACIVHFSQTNGVQCLDGDGSGGGTWKPAAAGQPVSGAEWTEVALRILYDAPSKSWDCLLNGAAYQTSLGFRNSLASLSGFKSLSGTTSYFDSFRVIGSDGDVDGDGIGDGFEIGNGTNPLNPASRPVAAFDVDGDGAITILDGLKQYRIASGTMTQSVETLVDANCDGLMNAEDGKLIYLWAIGDPSVPYLPKCQ